MNILLREGISAQACPSARAYPLGVTVHCSARSSRARGGHSLVWDPRGMPHAGGAKKAQNMDANVFAADMSDETAIAKASAERNFHKSQK